MCLRPLGQALDNPQAARSYLTLRRTLVRMDPGLRTTGQALASQVRDWLQAGY